MSQQMVNGSHYDGDITVTNRMSDRYAVINPPEQGKHRKTKEQRERRHYLNEFTQLMNEVNQLMNKVNQRKKGAPR